jgi:hypothetical protein
MRYHLLLFAGLYRRFRSDPAISPLGPVFRHRDAIADHRGYSASSRSSGPAIAPGFPVAPSLLRCRRRTRLQASFTLSHPLRLHSHFMPLTLRYYPIFKSSSSATVDSSGFTRYPVEKHFQALFLQRRIKFIRLSPASIRQLFVELMV